jgi:hypothetical protein
MNDNTMLGENAFELLLEISDLYEKKNVEGTDSSGKDTAINAAYLTKNLANSSIFEGYNLDEDDIKIIALILGNYLEGKKDIEAVEVIKRIWKDKKVVKAELKRLLRMNKSGILDVVSGPTIYNGNEVTLLRSSLTLSDTILGRIFGTESKAQENKEFEPYKDNLEYLADQFERVRILRKRPDTRIGIDMEATASRRADNKSLERIENRIAQRLKKTGRSFPMEVLKKEKGLSQEEELVILALLHQEIEGNNNFNREEDIIGKTNYERLCYRKLLQEDGRLFKERLIEPVSPNASRNGSLLGLKLNKNIKKGLLDERKANVLNNHDSFFEVVEPSISIDKIILHPKTYEQINLAIDMVKGRVCGLLNDWGIKGFNLIQSASKKRQHSVTMLFYGTSGTGKTLTANAVAYVLKKKLLTLDCSNILGMWVGESEKNARKIFDRYKEISSGMKNPPVLFLNEADQFLHRRIDAVRSTDNMYNQIQNIFLEQLERFEGVLIATTNLMDNLDPAFSRRFHYKIEFKMPGPKERLKLWQIHIPDKTPLSEDVNLSYLSERYALTGGQIAVVIRNAATIAARRGDKILMQDIISVCEDEVRGSFGERAKAAIGF